MNPHMVWLFIIPLIAFSLWRRVSRTFGRQPIRRKAMIGRIVAFGVIGALVSLPVIQQLPMLEGLLAGLLAGAVLGLVGLRLTQFTADPVKGDCYIPNPWIGALLTILLVVRVAWRFIVMQPQLADPALAANSPHEPLGQSPLTLLMFGLLIGYYICYYWGLLVHHRRWQAQLPPAMPGARD